MSVAIPPQFNVCRIHPPTYVHALALREAADYLRASLVACGYRTAQTVNQLARNAHNIVFCAHMLPDREAARLPRDTIIFNSEQLHDRDGWVLRSGVYRPMLEELTVWDYSPLNLGEIPHDRKGVVPFRYRPELLRSDIPREPGESLLFYGALTPRRAQLIEALRARGIPVEVLFGVYGDERDARIRRARAVLNLHKSDHTPWFEPIRCFYPLINEVPVITEEAADPVADEYRQHAFFVGRDSLVDEVAALWADTGQFIARSRAMLAAFRLRMALPELEVAVRRFLQDRASGQPTA